MHPGLARAFYARQIIQSIIRMAEGGDDSGGDGGENQPPPPPPETGFPANTRVEDMTSEQSAAYWKHHSRKWEGRANARGDYDQLKAKAAELDKVKADQMSEQDKAVAEARAEGVAEATRNSAASIAVAIFQGALSSRNLTPDDMGLITAAFNPAGFISEDGTTDQARVVAYADRIAGPVTGGKQKWPDMGGGKRENQKASGVTAGADLFAARHKPKTT